jgi:hypothetical protein
MQPVKQPPGEEPPEREREPGKQTDRRHVCCTPPRQRRPEPNELSVCFVFVTYCHDTKLAKKQATVLGRWPVPLR